MSDLPLERFIALNDEIAAMARIGIPFEVGLHDLGREMPRRLSSATERLRQRLAEGQPLETAFRDACSDFPPAYQAMVVAGLRSGRLPQALESISESTRNIVAMRRSVWTALVYPVVIVIVAYILFVVFAMEWTPTLVDFYRQLTASNPLFVQALEAISQTAKWWAPLAPLVVALPVMWWYVRSRRAGRSMWGRMRHFASLATFAELLAAMIEHRVPLDEALTLAAAATDNPSLRSTSQQWASQIQQGEPIAVTSEQRGMVPEWLAWLVLHADRQPDLARKIAELSKRYRREVQRLTAWYSFVFPLLATGVVGGSAVLISAVLILGPWFYVMYRIGGP